MDIRDYETVLAVWQQNSWTEAAYQTFQSPSTVSKRVSKVEKALGAPIFERRVRPAGLTLTEVGGVVMPYIQQMVTSHSLISAYAAETKSNSALRLSVGYLPLIGTTGETEILSRFRIANPDVSVSHFLRRREDLIQMLRDGRVDCAFIFFVGNIDHNLDLWEWLMDDGIRILTYMHRSTLSIGVSASHPLAERKSVRLRELCGETFVLNNAPGHADTFADYIRSVAGSGAGEPKLRMMDFVNKSVVLDYIASGAGILPTACLPPPQPLENVRFIDVEDGWIGSSAAFMYPKDSPSRSVKALLSFVEQYAGEGELKDGH